MTRRDPRAVLRDAGLRPKKSFGQNFLVAERDRARDRARPACTTTRWAARASSRSAPAPARSRGSSAERARTVAAIERDRDLVPLLHAEPRRATGARVVEADAQSVDLGGAARRAPRRARRASSAATCPTPSPGRSCASPSSTPPPSSASSSWCRTRSRSGSAPAPGTKEWGALTVFVRAALRRAPASCARRRARFTRRPT